MSCLCKKMRPEHSTWSDMCIGQLWLFDDLGQEEMKQVVQRARRRRYRTGQPIFRQGDAAEEISLIKAGRVRLGKLLEDGPELTLDIIAHLTDRLGAMSQSHLEERLYRVLLNVARNHGERRREGYVIQFPLTHEDLGFLIGAHRVSITRVMKKLRDSGRVMQTGRTLILTSAGAL